MPSGWIGYDPARIASLRRGVAETIAALRAVESWDPAAADAVAAARSAREHLEIGWMPILSRVAATRAMLGWGAVLTSSGDLVAGWLVPLSSWSAAGSVPAAAPVVAELAREVIDGDEHAMAELQLWFAGADADPATLAAFFADLGGRGTAALLVALGGRFEHGQALVLAEAVRDRLGDVAGRPAFPTDRFATDLLTGFVDAQDDSRAHPAAALSFLLRGPTAGTDLVVALTTGLIARERAMTSTVDTPWPASLAGSMLTREVAVGDEWLVDDPMHAAMDALAGDGDAASAVFADPALAAYLLSDRPWADGFVRVLAAGAAGATVQPGAPAATWDTACVVATQVVNRLAARPDVERAAFDRRTARSAATVLVDQLPAVDATVRVGGPPTVGAAELDHLRLPTLPEASAWPGGERTSAVFGLDALTWFAELAAGDDGLAELRAGLALHQELLARGTAAVLAADAAADPTEFLRRAMTQSGRLEGYLVQRAGHRAEHDGRSRDEAIARWLSGASLAARITAGSAVGASTPRTVATGPIGPVADHLREVWADHEDRAARDATTNADEATVRLTLTFVTALIDRGVIARPAVIARRPVPDFDELTAWPAAEQQRFWLEIAEPDPADDRPAPDLAAIQDAVRAVQLPAYQELE